MRYSNRRKNDIVNDKIQTPRKPTLQQYFQNETEEQKGKMANKILFIQKTFFVLICNQL